MFNKTAYINESISFYFPMPEDKVSEAIEFIEANGVESFIAHSNIAYYAPNILPFNKKTLARLEKKPPAEACNDIIRYIEQSFSLWSNPAAETTQNQYVNSRRLGYKVDHYGSSFMQGDVDTLDANAFRFPLMDEEMFIAYDIINQKGIRFFVEHCAPNGLPECPYIKNSQEETIASFASLVKWYGAYWLLGQLNDAAILNIKEKR